MFERRHALGVAARVQGLRLNVGCCDSSPGRHATKHFHKTQHPVMRSVRQETTGPGAMWTESWVNFRLQMRRLKGDLSRMDNVSYDVVVIGAGSTGENVADRAVKGGLTAVIVESDLVGGECSYWACMPSKALLRPGSALAGARSVSGAREAVTGKLNVAAVFKRRDTFTSNWDDSGQVKWLRQANTDLLRGHGRLAGERRVVVTNKDGAQTKLNARQAVVVCTGSQAAIPNVLGWPKPVRGRITKPSAPGRCHIAWRSSGAGRWPAKWPRPGINLARRKSQSSNVGRG